MADKSLDKQDPQLDDIPYDHRWGFQDTRMYITPQRTVVMTGDRYALAGYEMPEFIPFAEEMLDIKIDVAERKEQNMEAVLPEPMRNEPFCHALESSFPADQMSFERQQRLAHSHGQTTADEVYKVLYSELDRYADMVFFLEKESDAETLITLAEEHDVCLVPYGGGTSVSCALQLPTNEKRMIVIVNMRRLNKILWIDRENFLACVEAGMSGRELELALEKEGFTTGHEPDSMELSTVGGWVATNASGMKKNRYGNIEDIVANVTMVTPRGTLEMATTVPRVSMGMQPQQLLFGSEGNLGLITKAVLKIHTLPEAKKYGSIVFPDFKQGTEFLYELTQTGVLPASIRLLDNIQFRFGSALKPVPTFMEALIGRIQKFFLLKVKGFDPYEIAAATIVMEGTKEEVAFQAKLINQLAKKYGGVAGGEGNGRRGYMLTYAIAYIRDFLAEYHIIGETYETTVPWNKVDEVIDTVKRLVEEKHVAHGLPGRAYISPRITQLYHTGVCIYFTHGFSTKGIENPDEVLAKIEHELRQAIIDAGGSISHHHGVGKLRKDFMPQMMTPAGIKLLHHIKASNDPKNVFGIRNNVFSLSDEEIS